VIPAATLAPVVQITTAFLAYLQTFSTQILVSELALLDNGRKLQIEPANLVMETA
jgi:hypothetical protein